MAQRVMTTGGYPTKLPDADEISQDVSGDLMSRQINVSQISGVSDTVKGVLHAQTPEEIREYAGIRDSGIAVKGDTGQSAYELAVQLGFEGTKEEWIASLHGKDGSAWFSGSGEPNIDAAPGSYYLDLVTGDIYKSS